MLISSSRAWIMHEGSRGLGLDLGYHVHVGMYGSLGDENEGAQPMAQDIQDPLEVPEGPITRSRAKKIKDEFVKSLYEEKNS